jgi:hypothetical protein
MKTKEEFITEYVNLELKVNYKKTYQHDVAIYEFHGQHNVEEGDEEIEILSVGLETKNGVVNITTNTLKKILEELV